MKYIPLPQGWQEKKLIDFSPLQRGFDLPNSKIINGEYPVVYSNGIKAYHNEYKCKGIGVVTGRSGTIGKVTYVEKDYWPHNTSLWVTDFKGNFPKFVFYLLNYINLSKYDAGTSVPTLNRNDVHQITVFVPPLEEQKRIASLLSLCDEVIENLKKLIEKKALYKKGLMQRLLTGEVRFGGFTDEWKEVKISKLVEKNIIFIEKGKAISKNKIAEGNIPVIAGGKIPAYYHNEYTHDFPCITISASGSAGYVWFHNYKVWASDCNVLYTENTKYNIKFLYYYLTHIQEYIYNLKIGGVQPHVYAKDIITLTVPNIDIEEQKKIASLLTAADEEIDNLKKQLELRKKQKKGVMQRLLTGEVRV